MTQTELVRKKKTQNHEWPVKDMLAVAFRVSLDGSLEMSSTCSGRIELQQFCLSGQIVCLGVTVMIDNLLITDIVMETVSDH